MNEPTHRLVLRDLNLPARLVLSAFLISVGLGYAAAMAQIHFQQSGRNGSALPSADELVKKFHGEDQLVSRLEKLLTAPETEKFNGGGSMAPAFTTREPGFKKVLRKHSELEGTLRAERDGERKAILAWAQKGAPQGAYRKDALPLPADWADQPITPEFRDGDKLKVRSILEARCVRCHQSREPDDTNAGNYPLETYEQVAKYATVSRGMVSEEKLTQSTHVHLLGFAMLYLLTGLTFAFSSYPAWIRSVLAPLVLVVQMLDIGCWWLARLEGTWGVYFALSIRVTGAIVGVGLMVQILLSLFNMYGARGKTVLLLLFLALGAGGLVLNDRVIQPRLAQEREEFQAAQEAAREASAKDGERAGDQEAKGEKPEADQQ
jgi:hypothetical protein